MLLRSKSLLKAVFPLLALSLVACGGEDGEDGKDGADGMDGEDGDDGEDGADGMDGEDGADGMDGEDGENGMDGAPGMDGDPGMDGAPGMDGMDGDPGMDGVDGLNSLIEQTILGPGSHCLSGGLQVDSGLDMDKSGTLESSEIMNTSYLCNAEPSNNFNRISVFPVCSQIDEDCDTDDETAAEIVSVSEDGMTLIYSDSPAGVIGFVDITDPDSPVADGVVALGGEPTSVSVVGGYAVVGVNTSPDFDNPSGGLSVVDIDTGNIAATVNLGGQPDSVAVSPDGTYIAVAIENERDEDEADGELPQLPAGKLVKIDTSGAPNTWTAVDIPLTGGDGYAPEDPEPEFVDINSDNIAVVTLQENNSIALVDLDTNTVLSNFDAGSVDLTAIDTDDDGVIDMSSSLAGIPREPDGVSWIGTEYFATADEGDLFGGSRGFTVYSKDGEIVYTSGNMLDHLTARLGHYQEGRSDNKGNEPENIEYAEFDGKKLLFVNSERSSLVFVFDVANPSKPLFLQALPAALGPEGGLAIPSRNLLAVASEEDSREDGFRSVVNIYEYQHAPAQYPTLVSVNRPDGTPIPWAAMSGLGASMTQSGILYAVEDSAFLESRIFKIDTTSMPARLVSEMRIMDSDDVFASISVEDVDDSAEEDDTSRIEVFDDVDLAAMINDDKTVNIDPEGISASADGGFWVVSEGAGTIGDAGRPLNSLNFLFKTDENGVIEQVVTLPEEVNDIQLRFGFEGVAEYDGKVYVAFQRVWGTDSGVRIGIYDIEDESWEFVYYTLDAVESQDGGWVGLSDITSLGDGTFLIVERDNKAGPDAAVKRLYHVDLSSYTDGETVGKTLVDDLMDDLAATGGLIPEKIEGSAYDAWGNVWIINDNDGVDDNSGETQLLNLGMLL